MERLVICIGLCSVIILDTLGSTVLHKFIFSQDLKLMIRSHTDWIAKALMWILVTIGCYWFVVLPTAGYTLEAVALFGAFFGLIVYGIYECTNKALLFARHWKVVVWGVLWGMILCGSGSVIMALCLSIF